MIKPKKVSYKLGKSKGKMKGKNVGMDKSLRSGMKGEDPGKVMGNPGVQMLSKVKPSLPRKKGKKGMPSYKAVHNSVKKSMGY